MMSEPQDESGEASSANGRVAVVTGATDGIGRAVALRLAASGWHVVVVGRSAQRCAQTESDIAQVVGATDGASSVVADLTSLAETAGAVREITTRHSRLDLLLLNANTIARERVITSEGFEANLAIGLLSRVAMTLGLEELPASTADSQVLGVVGQDMERFDLANPDPEAPFDAMSALIRWQWAWQVWVREHAHIMSVPLNTYMPGLVRTKILLNEPDVESLAHIRHMVATKGVDAEVSGGHLYHVVESVSRTGLTDHYFAPGAPAEVRLLPVEPGDGAVVWAYATGVARKALATGEPE